MAKKTEFEKLKDQWYKKLKDEGFKDIEHSEDKLKVYTNSMFNQKQHSVIWEATSEYYRMADKFLSQYDFENELDRVIWTYHASAVSCRNIEKLLKQAKLKNCSYVTIWNTIDKLRTSMKNMYMTKTSSDEENEQ